MGAMAVLALFVVGCASKQDTLPEESKLAEADLFDGLKDQASSTTVSAGDEMLPPAEDAVKENKYAADNIVRGDSAAATNEGSVAYDYYYTAVGGEKIGRLAYAIYNSKKGVKHIFEMNPDLKGMKQVGAETKIYFDMSKASPRAEYLTKDMIDRYKSELRGKLKERRSKSEGNSELAETTVQKGETLQMISQRIYGTTRLWTELFLINQEKIGHFDNLKVGTPIAYYPVSDFMPAPGMAKSGGDTNGGEFAKMDSGKAMDSAPSEPAHVELPAAKAEPEAAAMTPATTAANTTTPPADLPPAVKVTEKPSEAAAAPAVRGGIPVEGSDPGPGSAPSPEGGGELARGDAPAAGAAAVGMGKRIRPPDPAANAEGGEDEGFFSRNLRRFVYIGFIALIVAGGYYLTRPNGGFKKNKFTGIQPMPNPMAGTQPAPRPRVGAAPSPNRVVVNRTGSPPPNRDGGEKKTG